MSTKDIEAGMPTQIEFPGASRSSGFLWHGAAPADADPSVGYQRGPSLDDFNYWHSADDVALNVARVMGDDDALALLVDLYESAVIPIESFGSSMPTTQAISLSQLSSGLLVHVDGHAVKIGSRGSRLVERLADLGRD